MTRAAAFLALAFVLFTSIPSASAQQKPSDASAGESKCEATTEDYAVYSAILKNLGHPEDPEEEWRDKTQMIIKDQTVSGPSSMMNGNTSLWGFRSASKQAPVPETVEAFNQRTKASCQLKTSLDSSLTYTLVSDDDVSKLFKKGRGDDGWAKFYKEYPKSSGYWDFSAVGYNKVGAEALVYVGHHCGFLCGTGHMVLLAKENGSWVVKNRVMLWIS
jgi:hypothetical protein